MIIKLTTEVKVSTNHKGDKGMLSKEYLVLRGRNMTASEINFRVSWDSLQFIKELEARHQNPNKMV